MLEMLVKNFNYFYVFLKHFYVKNNFNSSSKVIISLNLLFKLLIATETW